MLTSQPCTANQQSPGTLTTNSRRTAAKSVREIHTNSIDSERKSEKFRGITKHQSMVKNFAAETAHSGAIVRGPLQWLPQEYSRIPCSRQSQTSPPLSRLRQAAPHAPKPIAQFACPMPAIANSARDRNSSKNSQPSPASPLAALNHQICGCSLTPPSENLPESLSLPPPSPPTPFHAAKS